jgi:hypothetical protein
MRVPSPGGFVTCPEFDRPVLALHVEGKIRFRGQDPMIGRDWNVSPPDKPQKSGGFWHQRAFYRRADLASPVDGVPKVDHVGAPADVIAGPFAGTRAVCRAGSIS